jgi:hypothetical protein
MHRHHRVSSFRRGTLSCKRSVKREGYAVLFSLVVVVFPEGSWSSYWSYKDLLNTCAITKTVMVPLQCASPMQYLISGNILKRECAIFYCAQVFLWLDFGLEKDVVVCEFTHFRFINTNSFVVDRNTKAENLAGEPMHGTQDNPLHIKLKRNEIREDCEEKVPKIRYGVPTVMAAEYPRPANESAMCHASWIGWPSKQPPGMTVKPS